VFVQNVELVDHEKCLVVPSVVWLEPFDGVDSVLGRATYVSRECGLFRKILDGGKNGELCLSSVSGSKFNNRTGDQIKRSAARPAAPLMPEADPLRAAQRRCQELGEAAASDPDCLAVWAETRDRFLGRERDRTGGE